MKVPSLRDFGIAVLGISIGTNLIVFLYTGYGSNFAMFALSLVYLGFYLIFPEKKNA